MIARFGATLTKIANRVMPDPFVLALLLTGVVFLAGWGMTDSGPTDMVLHWEKGFWDLLKFAMQMALILVTGHAVATSPWVRSIIGAISSAPKSSGGAVMIVCVCALLASFVHWGLGVIVGALSAREVALGLKDKGVRVHYPLLGAAGYAGLVIWHGGLSGSAPLKVAEEGHEFASLCGVIPVSETLWSPMNLAVALGLLVLLPLLFRMMHPSDPSEIQTIDRFSPEESRKSGETASDDANASGPLVVWLETSPVMVIAPALFGLGYMTYYFLQNGFAINLNVVNFTFLFLGLLLQGNIRNYLAAWSDGTRAVGGILLQFPFYAGIMGMMKYSGLVNVFSDGFVSISNATTFPVLAFFSAGLVNLFVPSGGGQWAVQGPILLGAAKELGVEYPKVVMALAYGDQWTNMIQPFWALPLLGITGLKARDIMGYGAIALGASMLIFLSCLLIF